MLPNQTQMPDDRVRAIAELASAAKGFSVYVIAAPKEGAEGLPKEVMIGFDHRKTGPDAVIDLNPLFERYRIRPERKVGAAQVDTLRSFVALVDRHKTTASVIFAKTELPQPSFTAVIDYHDLDGDPDNLKHRVHYAFPLSEEFKTWSNNNANAMTQAEFAEFIEENIANIAHPLPEESAEYGELFRAPLASPVDMMTLSRGLEVTVNSSAKGAHRLQSGEMQIAYTEEHQTNLVVPGLFMVSIPVFFAGERVRLPARLRYRVSNGRVSWFYQLYRHEEIVRERVIADLQIAQAETGLPVYEGRPEA
jgi:uncharacterized protein YfdQ (DUF2303 family)